MSWQGSWAGQWVGEYDGSQSPADPNSLTGSALLTVSAVGLLIAVGHLEGTATLAIQADGTIERATPTNELAGAANLVVSAFANLTAVGFIEGTASISLSAYEYVEPTVAPEPYRSTGSGSGSSDGGRGYVYKDHQWVRLLPVRITRTRANDPIVTVGSTQRLTPAASRATSNALTTHVSTSSTLTAAHLAQRTYNPSVATSAHVTLTTSTLAAKTNMTSSDYLEFDELLAALEFTS